MTHNSLCCRETARNTVVSNRYFCNYNWTYANTDYEWNVSAFMLLYQISSHPSLETVLLQDIASFDNKYGVDYLSSLLSSRLPNTNIHTLRLSNAGLVLFLMKQLIYFLGVCLQGSYDITSNLCGGSNGVNVVGLTGTMTLDFDDANQLVRFSCWAQR